MTPESISSTATQRTREGLLTALIAYTLWGVLPIYFKIVETVPASEVLAHRVLWAVPFGLPILLLRRQWPEVVRALRTPRTFGLLVLAALLIAGAALAIPLLGWLPFAFVLLVVLGAACLFAQ